MRASLAAVTDHRNSFALQRPRIRIFLPEHLGHFGLSLEWILTISLCRARDCSLRRRRNQLRIFRHYARHVTRRRWFPPGTALLETRLNVQPTRLHVERDLIAVPQQGDRSTVRRLGRHVPDHQPVCCATETAVRDQRDRPAQALANKRTGHGQHFAHPRSAFGAFVTNHNHVAGLDLPPLYGCEAGFLGIENTRRAAVKHPLMARKLYHAAFRRERTTQDGYAAVFLDR